MFSILTLNITLCQVAEIPAEIEAYIQTIAIKKTLELISLDRRREIEEENK